MTGMEILGAVAIGMSVVSAGMTIAQGFTQASAQKSIADAQAKQMRQQAGQERALAQRQAYEQQQEGRIVASRARALAAASGGGASALDPTVLDIYSGIAGESEYRALSALYAGESRGQNLEYSARLAKATGQMQAQNSIMSGLTSGLSTIASAGSSLYGRYATSPPPSSIDANFTTPNGYSYNTTMYRAPSNYGYY